MAAPFSLGGAEIAGQQLVVYLSNTTMECAPSTVTRVESYPYRWEQLGEETASGRRNQNNESRAAPTAGTSPPPTGRPHLKCEPKTTVPGEARPAQFGSVEGAFT
jgi:hypothetical protein